MKHSPAFQPRPRRQERRNLEKLWRFPFPFSAINVSAGNQACLCVKITGSHLKHFKTSTPAQTLGRKTAVPVSLVSSQYGGCFSKEEMRQLFRRFSSYIAMSAYEVKHNVKGQEFYIALEKGLWIPRKCIPYSLGICAFCLNMQAVLLKLNFLISVKNKYE